MVEIATSVHKRVVDSIDGDWSCLFSIDLFETLTSVHKRVVDSIDGDWSFLVLLDRLKVCSGGIGLWVNSGDLGLLRSNLDAASLLEAGPNIFHIGVLLA